MRMVRTAPTSSIMPRIASSPATTAAPRLAAPCPIPTPTTPPTPTPTSTPLTTLTDSATLSGGYNPTGTITFYLFAPGATSSTHRQQRVYSDTVTVSGDGTYTTASGTNPGGYMPTVAGTYEWVAVYSGDSNNSGVTSPLRQRAGDGAASASPTISTTPSATQSRWCSSSTVTLTDTATLSGGYNPTGHDHLHLYARAGTSGGHGDGHGQRQRHLHHAERYTLPTTGHGNRHLPVGRHLQRRHQQQLGSATQPKWNW